MMKIEYKLIYCNDNKSLRINFSNHPSQKFIKFKKFFRAMKSSQK